ncbi:MAG: hypothetical protein COA45_11490 [Zetaproteobacteria bacterium]|nr:MAG: hypothetical protein COA45_11490 [Zetaproteobacteria bacterium]
MENEKEWFSVKGIFRWFMKETGGTSSFEERIVIFQAMSFDDAIKLAENEAKEYCKEDATANFKIESLGLWNAFSLSDGAIQNKTEVYSNLVDSDLSTKQYIEKYYPESGARN